MEIKRALEIIEEEIPFTSGTIEEAMEVLRNVVEKQTPKKVMPSCYSSTFKKCPVCNKIVVDCSTDTAYINSFCGQCGQRLDWSDESEN